MKFQAQKQDLEVLEKKQCFLDNLIAKQKTVTTAGGIAFYVQTPNDEQT
jgi:hypothetical protein